MDLKYEIKRENLKVLEIKEVLLNKEKFGVLTFDKAYPRLDDLRKILVEFEELNYTNALTTEEVTEVYSIQGRLVDFVQRVNNLHPETDDTYFNKDVRESLENEIERFYQDVIKEIRNSLVYLRQESALKSQDKQSLAEEQKAATRARKQYDELSQQLKSELESLKKQKGEIESAHGEIAATYLAAQFNKQAQEYEKEAKKWLLRRSRFYWGLIIIIGANFVLYLALFFLEKIGVTSLPPKAIFTVEYGVVKLALLTVLSYGVGFASKNYNVNSHLAAVNKHRSNVAQTLDDFFATKPERKSHMLQEGTRAMFRHAPVGYIRREEQRDNGPIHEIISKFSPSNE